MDYSLPGSSGHGISQARILEWVAISFSRGSSQPIDWNCISWITGRFFTTASQTTVHGVAKSRTRLSDFTHSLTLYHWATGKPIKFNNFKMLSFLSCQKVDLCPLSLSYAPTHTKYFFIYFCYIYTHTYTYISPILEYHINKIILNMLYCVWLLLLNIMF